MESLIRIWHLIVALIMHAHIGIATNFAPVDDPQNPDPHAACLHRDLTDDDVVIAHPSLPCRAKVWIYSLRTHRSIIAKVGDRGPRHALVDLAPATAKRLRANGWEPVILVSIGK